MKNIIFVNATVGTGASRKVLGGKSHLVIPVVAIVEGVLNGLLYTQSEISKFVASWNGRPVPVGHPKGKDGGYISANSPSLDDSVNIGKFFNATHEGGKLKGEIWIDVKKAESLGYSDIVKHFEKGLMMEVSTGLYSDSRQEAGTFNGVDYMGIAQHIRPDHLALLPHDVGACSIEDGCGAMRTNETPDTPGGTPMDKDETPETNENCCDDCVDSEVQSRLAAAFETIKSLVGFTADKPNSNNASEATMENDKATIVDGLIAHAQTSFAEADRDSLIALDADFLAKLVPAEQEAAEVDATVDKTPETPEVKGNTLSNADVVLFNRLKGKEEARVTTLQKAVADSFKLAPAIVATMSVEAIEALVATIKPAANYGAQAGAAAPATHAQVRTPPLVLLAPLTNTKEEAA